MCNFCDQIGITITRRIGVDRCLAQEILFLNDQGIRTVSCCCGHGDDRQPRHILIYQQDELKAKEMGYNPVPNIFPSKENPDENYLMIMPKTQGS